MPDGSTSTVYVPLAGLDGSGTESMKLSALPIEAAIIGAPLESSSMPAPPLMVEAEKRMNMRRLARPVNVTRPFVPGVERSSVVEPPPALGVTDARDVDGHLRGGQRQRAGERRVGRDLDRVGADRRQRRRVDVVGAGTRGRGHDVAAGRVLHLDRHRADRGVRPPERDLLVDGGGVEQVDRGVAGRDRDRRRRAEREAARDDVGRGVAGRQHEEVRARGDGAVRRRHVDLAGRRRGRDGHGEARRGRRGDGAGDAAGAVEEDGVRCRRRVEVRAGDA